MLHHSGGSSRQTQRVHDLVARVLALMLHCRKRSSYGHAMIIDPWGEVVLITVTNSRICMQVLTTLDGEAVGIRVAEVDRQHLSSIREKMPISRHERNDLYGVPPSVTIQGPKPQPGGPKP